MADSKYQRVVATQGDCVLSIAARSGVPWGKVWNDPKNSELAELRKTPSHLLPGDRVWVPPVEQKYEKGLSVGQRHRFRKKTAWVDVRIELAILDEPMADLPYYLLADDTRYDGNSPRTDANGLVECKVPADIASVTIVLGAEEETRINVQLGSIDPIDTPSGLHTRLSNLGLYDEPIDTPDDDDTETAMADFMEFSGADDATESNRKNQRKTLKDYYGS
jgi:hypothetical protein